MIYFLGAVLLVLLAAGIGLAIWVSRLKDQLQEQMVKDAATANTLFVERTKRAMAEAERDQLVSQLSFLQEQHERLVQQVENGALGDAAGIAAELRRGVQNP